MLTKLRKSSVIWMVALLMAAVFFTGCGEPANMENVDEPVQEQPLTF